MFKRGDLVRFINDNDSWYYTDLPHKSSDDDIPRELIRNSKISFLEILEIDPNNTVKAYVPTLNKYLKDVEETYFELLENQSNEQT